MLQPKLYMILMGCKPKGRHTEQNDIFFGIAQSLKELIPDMEAFWPGSGKLHIDAWREVTRVENYLVSVIEKSPTKESGKSQSNQKLFFINLGGYKKKEFEEYHYKMLAVGTEKTEAIQLAKQTAFYKHTGFKGADSHIDDKYGIDVDDIYQIEDILSKQLKKKYTLQLLLTDSDEEDEWHLGYTKFSSLLK